MAKANEQTWRIVRDVINMEVKWYTRSDDVCRQVLKAENMPENIRKEAELNGYRAVCAERDSQNPSSAISATIESRKALIEWWETEAKWKMPKIAGSFSVKIEVEAAASLLTKKEGRQVLVKEVQLELAKMSKEAKAEYLKTPAIQEEAKRMLEAMDAKTADKPLSLKL